MLLGNPRLLPYQISYRRIEDPRELDQLLDLEGSAAALPLADLDLLDTDGLAQLPLLEVALDATYLDPMWGCKPEPPKIPSSQRQPHPNLVV